MRKTKYSLLGLAIATVVAMVAYQEAFPALDPSIWGVLAEISGLQSAAHLVSAFWRRLVAFGVAPQMISRVSVAVLGFGVFELIWRMTVLLVCPPADQRVNWWRITVPLVASECALLLVFSDPVWRLTLSGGPALMVLALIVAVCDLCLAMFFRPAVMEDDGELMDPIGYTLVIFALFFVAGLLVVDVPCAVVLPVLFNLVHHKLRPIIESGRYQQNPDDLLVFVPTGVSYVSVVVAWGCGVVVGWMVASGAPGTLAPVDYAVCVVKGVISAATLKGWGCLIACSFVPFAGACWLLSQLVGEGRRLKFVQGLCALACGGLALLAIVQLPGRHLAVLSSDCVRSPLLFAFGAVLSVMAVAFVLLLFSFYAFHVKLSIFRYRVPVAVLIGLTMAVLLLSMSTDVRRPEAHAVRQQIVLMMKEMVREAKGLKVIFTDGSFDAGLKLYANQRGMRLETVPLAADGKGRERLVKWLKGGTENWQVGALQVGFDVWESVREDAPKASGMLVRAGDWPAGVSCESGVNMSKSLGVQMKGMLESGVIRREYDYHVQNAYLSLCSCISRLARLRGDVAWADALDAVCRQAR